MKLPALAALAALLAAPAALAQAPASATVELKNATGGSVGKVTITEAPKGVLVRVMATGLTQGWHGLHFHAKGDCSKSDFTSAGGHTHAGAAQAVHGLLNPNANETGDLPNIFAAANGSATAEVFSSLVTLKDLRDADGSAIVIHANADDHMAQPIGGAGARVACGVVK